MKIEDTFLLSPGGESTQRSIAVTSFEPEVANGAAILFLSGYRGIRQRYMRYAVELGNTIGISSLTVDLSGHGESSGSLKGSLPPDHAEDAKVAYDFLSDRPNVESNRI